MKKSVIILLTLFLSFMVYSCRQQEEMLSSDELATLQVIQNSNTSRNRAVSDTINISHMPNQSSAGENQGEPVQPPR